MDVHVIWLETQKSWKNKGTKNVEQNQWIINYLTHETLILYSSLFSNVIYIKQYYNTIY